MIVEVWGDYMGCTGKGDISGGIPHHIERYNRESLGITE